MNACFYGSSGIAEHDFNVGSHHVFQAPGQCHPCKPATNDNHPLYAHVSTLARIFHKKAQTSCKSLIE